MSTGALPQALLLILLVMTPLITSHAMADSFVLPKQAFVAAMAVLLGTLFVLNRMGLLRARGAYFWPICRTPLDRPLLALGIALLLSNLVNGGFPFLWYGFLAAYVWIYFLLTSIMAHDPRRIRACLDAALIAGVLVALHGLAQDFGWIDVPFVGGVNDWRARVFSFIGNPNFVAMVLAYIAPYAVIRTVWAQPVALRSAYLLALVPLAMCLVVVWSAGAWSGIGVALPIALWISWRCELTGNASDPARGLARPHVWVSAMLLVLAGAVLFYLLPLPFNGRNGSIVTQALASPQWKGGMGARRFIWGTTWLMIADHPFFGVGLGNYFARHQQYQGIHYVLRGTPHDRPTVGLVNHAHNEYLQRFAEAGILGFCAAIWLVVAVLSSMRHGLRADDPDERRLVFAACCGLWVALIHALVDMPFYLPASGLLLVLLAAAVSGAAVRRTWSTIPRPVPIAGGAWRGALLCLVAVGLLIALARPVLSQVGLRTGSEGGSHATRAVLDRLAAGFDALDRALERSPLLFGPDQLQLRYLGLAVRLDPHNDTAEGQYGTALLQHGYGKLGVLHLERACRRLDRIELRKQILAAALQMQDLDTAVRAMEAITALNPCWPEYLDNLAELYDLQQRRDRADRCRTIAEQLRLLQAVDRALRSATEEIALPVRDAT